MSHQFPSHDAIKEPQSISLKVIRLSRPSLVAQYPVLPPSDGPSSHLAPVPASLAYGPGGDTNPEPFILSPILNLPPSFGSAYVGETFSCTLCANNDVPDSPVSAGSTPAKNKFIRDVRIEAEMKTPSTANTVKLELSPQLAPGTVSKGVDLDNGQTLQKIVNFDLKEEGNHVLAVTVSYYEATETSGRTRTFRKLYQFICKTSLIVRTKSGALPPGKQGSRWVLEAQLENCSEDAIQLESVGLELDPGLDYEDCNWEVSGSQRPVLQPGEVEQVFFVVQVLGQPVQPLPDGRFVLGTLGVGWRNEMGNRGFLSTGKLGVRLGK